MMFSFIPSAALSASSRLLEISAFPESSKLIYPRSNNASKVGVSKIPL